LAAPQALERLPGRKRPAPGLPAGCPIGGRTSSDLRGR
jgi:hypothetical protein